MNEQTISCPKCKAQIPLTAALAQPIIDQAIAEKQKDIDAANERAKKAQIEFESKQAELDQRGAEMDQHIRQAVTREREILAKQMREELKEEFTSDVERQKSRVEELLLERKLQNDALAAAERARQVAELKAESVELEVTKKVAAQLKELREQALREADEASQTKLAEKDALIERLKAVAEELKRKADQSSQQLQGETQELILERALRERFTWDTIEEVGKGIRGGDVLHRVHLTQDQVAGTILYEVKQTQAWSKDWPAKLKSDVRACGADAAMIVSNNLPEGVIDFGLHDGVWICKPACAISVAEILRAGLLEVHSARRTAAGRETKAVLVYDYLTGPEFKRRMEGIAEPFIRMQADLNRERRAAEKAFNQRHKQIDLVLKSCFGMMGDLHALAGQDIAELDTIELKALEAKTEEPMATLID